MASALPSDSRVRRSVPSVASGQRSARWPRPVAASFLCSATVGFPAASKATDAGISFCVTGSSGEVASTCVIDTASRRGVAYRAIALAAVRKPRSVSPSTTPSANAWPSAFSAFGGSSSVKSSTTSVAVWLMRAAHAWGRLQPA